MTTTSLKVCLYRQVHLIFNPTIRDFVLNMLSCAPEGFFERPASTRHHPLDERGESGNILHTIRVVKMVLVMTDISTTAGIEKDVLIASAILHDLCRHGLDGGSEHSHKDHPRLVRRLAEKHGFSCDHYDLIMRIIGNHMGRWGSPQFIPHMSSDAVLHFADCICARALEVM